MEEIAWLLWVVGQGRVGCRAGPQRADRSRGVYQAPKLSDQGAACILVEGNQLDRSVSFLGLGVVVGVSFLFWSALKVSFSVGETVLPGLRKVLGVFGVALASGVGVVPSLSSSVYLVFLILVCKWCLYKS